MSFPDDTRPDTRKYVVASWVLRFVFPAVTLSSVVVLTLVGVDSWYDRPWPRFLSWVLTVSVFGPFASLFVDRAKKKADARWALRVEQENSRVARLARDLL